MKKILLTVFLIAAFIASSCSNRRLAKSLEVDKHTLHIQSALIEYKTKEVRGRKIFYKTDGHIVCYISKRGNVSWCRGCANGNSLTSHK